TIAPAIQNPYVRRYLSSGHTTGKYVRRPPAVVRREPETSGTRRRRGACGVRSRMEGPSPQRFATPRPPSGDRLDAPCRPCPTFLVRRAFGRNTRALDG